MYGLILEGIHAFVASKFGEETWQEIIRAAEADIASFSTHDVYSDRLVPKIAEAATKVLNMPTEQIMEGAGEFFIEFVGRYGYDNVLKVLGRDLRDFLNGLDNLHQYLRFTYPKLKSPSFFCVNESRTGLTLQYCSKRRGLQHYIKGQIREISRRFYDMAINIQIVSMSESDQLTSVIYRLHFDNKEFVKLHREPDEEELPVPSELFFEVFPFNIVFNRGMKVINIGTGLQNVMPESDDRVISDIFSLIRPLIDFTWEGVIMHSNNVFEMISLYEIGKAEQFFSGESKKKRNSSLANSNCLKLKGQMMYIVDWDAIIFLGTPVLPDINSMLKTGLYINDLSMHDSSRDLVLAGSQQSAELKMALDREQQKSKKLEDIMRQLDAEIKRTDELLYQMIPKSIAYRLRRGVAAIDTCRTFEDVTILFSDVVGFTNICSHLQPLQVVTMLNTMYTIFDQLTEKNRVYKVETIGDAYMIVAGAPTQSKFAAIYIAEMAFDMVSAMSKIKDPADSCISLRIRVGIHTGLVIAGVVGLKMPRYCFFGDTVQVSNKMEQTSEPQKIQISESTRNKLINLPYTITAKGQVEVKGKGLINTFWLTDRNIGDSKFESLLLEMNEEWMSLMADEAEQYQDAERSSALSGSMLSNFDSETHSRSPTLLTPATNTNVKKTFGFSQTPLEEKKAANGSNNHLSVPEKAVAVKDTPVVNEKDKEDADKEKNKNKTPDVKKTSVTDKQKERPSSLEPLNQQTVGLSKPRSPVQSPTKFVPKLQPDEQLVASKARVTEKLAPIGVSTKVNAQQATPAPIVNNGDSNRNLGLQIAVTATASLTDRSEKPSLTTSALPGEMPRSPAKPSKRPVMPAAPVEIHVTNEKESPVALASVVPLPPMLPAPPQAPPQAALGKVQSEDTSSHNEIVLCLGMKRSALCSVL